MRKTRVKNQNCPVKVHFNQTFSNTTKFSLSLTIELLKKCKHLLQACQDEEGVDGWCEGQVGLEERNSKGVHQTIFSKITIFVKLIIFFKITIFSKLIIFSKKIIFVIQDCDETFAKERDWALSYGSQIRDASEKFSAVISARLRLIQQLGHLSGALSITVAGSQHFHPGLWTNFPSKRKRGGQWGLQQAHKRIFRLHRDYKGEKCFS